MHKLEIEWSLEIYIDADSAEETENKFREMSWEEVLYAGLQNGIYEDYTIKKTEV